ncbi:general transcription factor IIE polypeptide 1 GTF2E1 [Cardiosporidium cionae]|uniref:General transcription factor IIE polypeptide 1 GTF2E1 n=1 Tax=Cardiosporidium cionae TaxID=476202 RepID=A0ABQ7JAA5_9APIC|nr:general transcription factor IIE polypeptide 1 GTF2E1 [Cardiosporidium cionae]|eukprot:KAF8820921.1 general transcription factor IIE polypeptide 1 GTF2E1 [Cardiosporidium cionae]
MPHSLSFMRIASCYELKVLPVTVVTMTSPSVQIKSSSTSSSASPPPSVGGILSQSDANSATGGGENPVTDSPRRPPAAVSSSFPIGTGLLYKQYDSALFQSLVGVYSRLFCDDEQIVVMDLLSREEHSYTERELVERLGWQEKRLREICSRLEKDKILIKEQLTPFHPHGGVAATCNSPTASDVPLKKEKFYAQASIVRDKTLPSLGNAPFYYRINSHIIPLLQWRSQKIIQVLDTAIYDGKIHDCYKCPNCGREFDSLQAQCLELHPEDAHFLCRCGSRLEHEDNTEELLKITHLQRCCQEQLAILHKFIERIWGMEIPIFTPYSKSKKATENEMSGKKHGVSSVVGSCLSAGSSAHSDGDVSQRTPQNGVGDASLRTTGTHSHFKLEMHQMDAARIQKKGTPQWLQRGGQHVEPSTFSDPSLRSFYPTSTVKPTSLPPSLPAPPSASLTGITSSLSGDGRSGGTASSLYSGIRPSSTAEGTLPKKSDVSSSLPISNSSKPNETRSQVRFSVKNLGMKLTGSSQATARSSKGSGITLSKPIQVLQSQPSVSPESITATATAPSSTFLRSSHTDQNTSMAISAGQQGEQNTKKRSLEEAYSLEGISSPSFESKKERTQEYFPSSAAFDETTPIPSAVRTKEYREDQSKEESGGVPLDAAADDGLVASEIEPKLFISKFNKSFTLNEAHHLQQEMTHDEFEKFAELQDEYLNVF